MLNFNHRNENKMISMVKSNIISTVRGFSRVKGMGMRFDMRRCGAVDKVCAGDKCLTVA